jgi:hypothetical protein
MADNSYLIPFEAGYLESLFDIEGVLDRVPCLADHGTFECSFDGFQHDLAEALGKVMHKGNEGHGVATFRLP